MKEYILWATDQNGQDRPISEKVYDLQEHNRRLQIAKLNGWRNLHTQIIDLSDNNINSLFIKAINGGKTL